MFDTILHLSGSILSTICMALCFVLFFRAKSKDKDGNRIELVNHTTEKPWSIGVWVAGVFVAGMGVGFIYAPSDLVGYVQQGLTPIESILMIVILNGAPVWALYAILGLWYMKHMDSKIGKFAAMLSTVLGMSISLWTGTNTIVKFIGADLPGLKFTLAMVMVGVALLSAKFGWLKKISKIAFLVFILAMLAVIATPLTDINTYPVTGNVTGNFWKEYFVGDTSASWIFWYLSWAPTVSRWLAHISKGRTMKEYVAGTIALPTLLAAIWIYVSWTYQEVITNFNIIKNVATLIPSIIFVVSGMLLMSGTLDSDCKVFTEDLNHITKGKLKSNTTIPYYGLFVIFIFCLFISGIIVKPFAFNEYSSTVFLPLLIWSAYESVKFICTYRRTKNVK